MKNGMLLNLRVLRALRALRGKPDPHSFAFHSQFTIKDAIILKPHFLALKSTP